MKPERRKMSAEWDATRTSEDGTNEVCSLSSEVDLPTDLDRSAPWQIRWPTEEKKMK